ncbi:class I SAM-dependent methyltransferase [Amylibacter sp.]|nr:class I SAM-dependent methyltransferase [Amylibacter sp.]MDC1532067.1 class I SAM-dependent methyltransferase [Amylibacter sp.]
MFGKLYFLYQRYVIKRLYSEQRIYFDNYLIPKYVKDGLNILFIGADWYNKWIFLNYKKTNWITIDTLPGNRKFGAENHIIGNFPEDLEIILHKGKFDIIIFNGVYGWGINSEGALQDSMQKMNALLKLNGLIIFGYNTEKEKNPISRSNLYEIIQKNFLLRSETEIHTKGTINDKHIFCILQKIG